MKLIDRAWGIFEKKDLREIGDLEQSLATGLDKEGKAISPIKILNQVGMKILNETLDDYDKLRLLLITTISLEMVEKDRKTLTDKIKVLQSIICKPEYQRAITNLIYLGVNP
jgi:syntaxin-binding protein 1